MLKREAPPPTPQHQQQLYQQQARSASFEVLTSSPIAPHDGKRFRDLASPLSRSKSSHVSSSSSASSIKASNRNGNNGNLARNGSNGNLVSTPLRNQTQISYNNKDDGNADAEKQHPISVQPVQQRRGVVLQKKKAALKAAILSPAANASPKANLPSHRSLLDQTSSNKIGRSKGQLLLSSTNVIANPTHQHSPAFTFDPKESNENFEAWYRKAQDNKINLANSWESPLIDYFAQMDVYTENHGHDLSSSEKGVNFQKASCTLDGCVKTYAGRVDSVADATNKLLFGLGGLADDERSHFSPPEGTLKTNLPKLFCPPSGLGCVCRSCHRKQLLRRNDRAGQEHTQKGTSLNLAKPTKFNGIEFSCLFVFGWSSSQNTRKPWNVPRKP